ncbi:hypothetical protein BDQ12DRAFT_687671 [Crucibulum laeve]|uniref:DUF6533 domain-containing protein n=1 Tax=Crucibulum laeve TaxID=68775 RepID=A0A5C3M437_9AGAR|nr:hypothetical protein BDQ12DRAFT_687671 [Crucibulum laeve]
MDSESNAKVPGMAYLIAATNVVLIYDYICTLDLEVTYIWSRPWSLGSVLFLINRYTPFVDTALSLYLLRTVITPESCLIHYRIMSWFIAMGMTVSEWILMLRTIAMWKRKKSIVILVAILALCTNIPGLVVTELEMRSLEFTPIPEFRVYGCNLYKASKIIIVSYLVILLSETVIVVLTMIKGYEHIRRSTSPWVIQMYRDGLLFYIYILMFTLGNVIVPIVAQLNYKNILANPQRVFHSILCSRVIFGILEKRSNGIDSSHPMALQDHRDANVNSLVLTSIIETLDAWEPDNNIINTVDERDWTE